MCKACEEDNPDWDCDDDEEEMDEDDEWVDKDWNGQTGEIEIEKKWLDRAKTLIREHKITVVEEAYKAVVILETEMECEPYDEDVANTMVVALRETKDEREIMARRLTEIRAKKTDQPNPALPTRKGQRKKQVAIPGCTCGTNEHCKHHCGGLHS